MSLKCLKNGKNHCAVELLYPLFLLMIVMKKRGLTLTITLTLTLRAYESAIAPKPCILPE